MKDMGEADVILGIKIIRNNDKIHLYSIEKVLGSFNYKDCSPVATPFDPSYKLARNSGRPIAQIEYANAIGCLIYAMTSTRPDITFAVGKLSQYTSNPSKFHWHAIHQVLKYLKKTQDYDLCYSGYPSVLEGDRRILRCKLDN